MYPWGRARDWEQKDLALHLHACSRTFNTDEVLVRASDLRGMRRHALFACAICSAILTPADVASMVLMLVCDPIIACDRWSREYDIAWWLRV